MTNIEFLVDELRKANETIAQLRRVNSGLKAKNEAQRERIEKLTTLINKKNVQLHSQVNLGDLDALAILKKQMDGAL